LGEKYEKGKKKRGGMQDKKEERGKKKVNKGERKRENTKQKNKKFKIGKK
jgi:hypothetical protein